MKWFHSLDPSSLARVAAHRICIVKPSAFGDIVQSLPVLSALRARFPAARLSWVVKREWSDLLAGHPDLDELITLDTRGSLLDWARTLTELQARRFDLVFDLQGLLRSAIVTWATRAPVRVGLQTAREGANCACNCVLPGTGRLVPAHERYRRVAEAVAARPDAIQPHLAIAEESRQWATGQLDFLSGPRVAIHLGAAWETKRWPVARFAAVAAEAIAKHGAAIVLVGGRSDAAAAAECEMLLRQTGRTHQLLNLVGQSDLKQLAALLAQMDVLVSNDSGPMHLAAALGTPVVGIFTCTDPRRSGPPGSQHELVATQVACHASYRKHCPHSGSGHHACLRELEVQRVSDALGRVLCRVLQEQSA
jgi:lipopolysaccharide heptosyltransferase I